MWMHLIYCTQCWLAMTGDKFLPKTVILCRALTGCRIHFIALPPRIRWRSASFYASQLGLMTMTRRLASVCSGTSLIIHHFQWLASNHRLDQIARSARLAATKLDLPMNFVLSFLLIPSTDLLRLPLNTEYCAFDWSWPRCRLLITHIALNVFA